MSEPVVQSRRSIYIGGLADEVKEASLRALCIPFGPIKSVEIPMDYSKGSHKGFAFVEYNDAENAGEAIYNLDGSELFGKVLSVSLAQEGQRNTDHTKAIWSSDDFFASAVGERDNKQNISIESLKEG